MHHAPCSFAHIDLNQATAPDYSTPLNEISRYVYYKV